MVEERTVTLLKALADPTRLDIVRRLAKQGKSTACSTVRTCSELSQPTMSHHFTKLVDAGVILERKEGKEKFYELNQESLQRHGLNASQL